MNDKPTSAAGFVSAIPKLLDPVIEEHRIKSPAQVREHCRKLGIWITKCAKETKIRSKAKLGAAPEHIRKVYEDKDWGLLFHVVNSGLAKESEDGPDPALVKATQDEIWKGIPMRGIVSGSGFWRPIPFERIMEQQDIAEEAEREQSKGHPADHWAAEEDLAELQKQANKMVEAGLWKVVPEAQIENGAVGFPVVQRNKTRLCIGFRRFANRAQVTVDKIRLLSTQCVTEILGKLAGASLPRWQNKKTAQEDANREKALREHIRGDEVLRAKILSSKSDLEGAKNNQVGFLAAQSVDDLTSYYYQLAAELPHENAFFLALPRTEEEKEPKQKRRWVGYESFCMLFGALSSVHKAVGLSEQIMCGAVVVLRLICAIYIDDVSIVAREECLSECRALMTLFLQLVGLRPNIPKSQAHSETQRAIQLLGFDYFRPLDGSAIWIQPPEAKVEDLKALGRTIMESSAAKKTDLKLLRSFQGKFRAATQLSRIASALARGFDIWTAEPFFKTAIKKRSERKRLAAQIWMMCDFLSKFKPFKITRAPKNVASIYSDAARDAPKLTEALEKGAIDCDGVIEVPEGLATIGAFVGSSRRGWTISIRKFPAWLGRILGERKLIVAIGILEAVAAHLAVQLKERRGLSGECTLIHNIDNMGVAFGVISGGSKCVMQRAICYELNSLVIKAGLDLYPVWIYSERNPSDICTRLEKIAELVAAFPGCSIEHLGERQIPWNKYRSAVELLTCGSVEISPDKESQLPEAGTLEQHPSHSSSKVRRVVAKMPTANSASQAPKS